MTDFSAQAGGKLILIGEHAVVYGYPAIALPLPQLSLKIRVIPRNAVSGNTLWETNERSAPGDLQKMDTVFAQCLELFARDFSVTEAIASLKKNPPLFKLTSSLPLGAGLGGSAAFSVALVRVCAKILKITLSLDTVERYAHHLESVFHRTSSGLDTRAVLSRQPIFFQRNAPWRSLPSLPPCWIVLIHTQEYTATSTMIERLKTHLADIPTQHQHLDSLGTLTHAMMSALESQDLTHIGDYLTQSHRHLQALKLSTPALDNAVEALCDNGALGAKMTGGGGGGIAFGLFTQVPNISLFDKFGRVFLLNSSARPYIRTKL
ncbi:MAG: mevalonate kinase [Holosporales bacterium]|jgi:mevalonate kinase|nr:mevalonate kinase [Holosporales bacterium]